MPSSCLWNVNGNDVCVQVDRTTDLPQLMMGSHPNTPIKTRLIHLTHAHHSLAWTALNMLRALTLASSRATSANTKAISWYSVDELTHLLPTVPEVKNKMVISVLAVYPHDRTADWEPRLAADAQRQERVSHCSITSPGKDPNSKFKVQFLLNAYCFHTTVKWKNPKLNHCTLGAICTPLLSYSSWPVG